MKIEYSPGLIGYGAKGTDGSAGLQGLAIYFTDFNPIGDIITLQSAIKNNEVLWSTAAPGTKLPGERKYSAGDLIIDSRGFIYIITDSINGDYNNTGMLLNKSSFFQKNDPDIQSNNDFLRYFNKLDTSLRYIIDNVFTDIAEINYTLSPSKIYGIAPRNFARIEYSNINDVSYNAFSLYSSGEDANTEDHKSLAIVREIASNKFHIGNLDSNNLFRSVDLILDVSSLRYTRGAGNQFNKDTISGTILTNTEKNANVLFDDSFTSFPGSFVADAHPSWVILSWVLSDFCPDPCSGILYFYKKENATGNFTMDPSRLRPLVFHNVGSSGSITISALSLGQTYEYFISICKNGWERNSTPQQITTVNIPAIFTIVNPAPPTLIFPAASSLKYATTITTDSFTGWNLTAVPKPSWISTLQTSTTIPITGGTVGTYVFDISVSGYNGYFPRSGDITFISEAPTKTITITQNRRSSMPRNIYMSRYDTGTYAKGRINIGGSGINLDPGQVVTVNVKINVQGRANGSWLHRPVIINTRVNLFKNGIQINYKTVETYSWSSMTITDQSSSISIPGIVNGDILEIGRDIFDFGCFDAGTAYAESRGALELVSVTDGWDSFPLVSGQEVWNCYIDRNGTVVSSTDSTIIPII